MLAPMSIRSRLAARTSLLTALSLALVLAWSPTAHAWPAVDPAGHRVALLGGRWTLALPEDATAGPIAGDPHGPMARAELDGVAQLASPEGRFAVRATLLEASRPDDLAATVATLPQPCAGASTGPLGERTDAIAIRCTTPSPDGAFRPFVVYAVHTDGWVERFEAQIETTDPLDAAARESGVAFAEAVLATLRAEDAAPAVERGTIEVAQACAEGDVHDTFTVTLPEGWVATRQSMPGATLVSFFHVVPLAQPRPVLALTVAPNADMLSLLPAGAGTPRSSTLLGARVDWLAVGDASGARGMREVAVDLTVDCGGGDSFARTMQLSVGGPEAMLDEGQHVLESLALASTRGHTAVIAGRSTEAPVVEDDGAAIAAQAREDEAAQASTHLTSMIIGGISLAMLAVAMWLRGRTTRPK
jgi:hypothetical protein